jgi:MiaB/RimO family radical SAM methylthiotransferase
MHRNNIAITPNSADADYAIVITCGVDATNRAASLTKIAAVSETMQKGATLLIGGCLPSISPAEIGQFSPHHTFSPRNIESLDAILSLTQSISAVTTPNHSIFDISKSSHSPTNRSPDYHTSPARERFERAKSGYKIIIAKGCLGSCSYCMIQEATGTLESAPMQSVLEQISAGNDAGEPSIMLLAGDTGAYGRDINMTLPRLLENAMALLEGSPQASPLFLHDFGVEWLSRDIAEYKQVFARAEPKHLIGGITFPIQSGSDRILQSMRRKYRRDDALASLITTKKYSFDIGTHIMVGFPGESEDDFQETIDLLERVRFDFITCFAYSENERAASAALPTKIPRTIVDERLARLSTRFGAAVKVIA